jgi:rod shape-determining protein MreB
MGEVAAGGVHDPLGLPRGTRGVEDEQQILGVDRFGGAVGAGLIEEPVAASLGAGLPIDGPSAFMVVDIGGGTTDIAVLSRGNVVQARSLRVAGNAMDEAVMRYIRRKHGLVIGEANAERIKIEAGTALALPNGRQIEIHIKGRDLRQGRMKSAVLGPAHMSEALAGPVGEMAEFIQRALEDLPPEIAAEVVKRGIVLTGGVALLKPDVALAQIPRLWCRRPHALRYQGHGDGADSWPAPAPADRA